MSLPRTGSTLNEFANQPSPYTSYPDDFDFNFAAIEAEFNAFNVLVEHLDNAGFVEAADAATNIPNMLVNGTFALATCAPLDENDDTTTPTDVMIPVANASGIKQVRWSDCWLVEEDTTDGLDVVNIEITDPSAGGDWHDPIGGIRFARGSGPMPRTGRVFQRVDLYTELVNLQSKTMQVVAQYTAQTDDEFYIEVDDGVSVTNNSAIAGGPSPAGFNATSRHSHTINPFATKLTVSYVLQTSAPPQDDDALVIHQAFSKLGVATYAIPSATPPAQVSRDLTIARMFYRQIRLGGSVPGFIVAGSLNPDGSSDEQAHIEFPLHSPIINLGTDNTQLRLFIVGATGTDLRYAGGLLTPPAWALKNLRPNHINRLPGDDMALTGWYHDVDLRFKRELADTQGQGFGFQADTMGVGISTIPTP